MKRIKSVLTDDTEHCIICGRDMIQIHHVLYGAGNRKLSDQDGYIIPLCHAHHTGRNGIHFNKELDTYWKRKAQEHYERTHSRKSFIERYGRSYL